MAADSAARAVGCGGAVGLGAAFDALVGQPNPGQLGEHVGGGGERGHRASAGHHGTQPGDSEAPVTPSCSSRGTIPRLQPAQW
jgi:hypothetical protein